MHDQKLIKVLAEMTKGELEKCKKYLLATMRTTSYEYKLFDYIYKSRNNWNAKRLGIEYAIVTVRRDSSIKQFENIMSALTRRIEQYLMLYDLDSPQRRFENELRLAAYYKRKGMNKFFRQTVKKLDALLADIPIFDTNYSLYLLQLKHLTYFSNLEDAPKDILEENLVILEDFFEKKQQVYNFERQNLKNIFSRDVPLKEKSTSDQVLQLFRHEHDLLFEKKDTAYLYLKNLLLTQPHKFTKEHAYRLHTYLVNFCIAKIKENDRSYIADCSQLKDYGLTSGITLWNGKNSEKAFLFHIDLKSKLEKPSFSEIKDLIEACHLYVSSENIANLKAIAYATYFFAIRNFDEVWECIKYNTFSRRDGTLFNKANILLLICQYKSNSDHLHFQSVIDKTRKKFSKKIPNFSDNNRQASLNLISCIEKLWKKESLELITQFVTTCKPITQKNWIMEEIKLLAQNSYGK